MLIEWRDVVGYEGLYEVSNTGEVRTNKNKTTFTERHGIRYWKQRVLKQKISKDRNHRVDLWREGRPTTLLVHRLVATAFLEKPAGKNYINHIDGNRDNNRVDNLEWCDHKENNNHAFDTGLMSSNIEVILVDTETHERHVFRSLSKASEFLGKNAGYLSGQLIKGITRCGRYEVQKVKDSSEAI